MRSLRRSPGFVAIAAVSLGTALGLSTAVFAMMDAMTHPESAYTNVDQVFRVFVQHWSRLGPTNAEALKAIGEIRGVSAVTSYRQDYADMLAGWGEERRQIIFTAPGFFEMLGVHARLGRLPTRDDAVSGQMVVVSDALWRRKFENRRSIGDAAVSVGDREYRVIGVLPPAASLADVWIPDPTGERSGGNPVVRLTRGFTDTVAVQSQLQALTQRWTSAYTEPKQLPFSARLWSMRPDPLALQDFHRAMIGAAFCVLLIACANVAALMLARGAVRHRDYALRLALGAGPGEIAREVIVEVAVLATVGCVLGSVIAAWAADLITVATPEEMHWMGFVSPQWSVRVLALSAAALVISIAVSGGFPAWRASRTDPMGPLKESGGGTTGRAGTRFRWLVMAELAISMTLVMGASLMVKSTRILETYQFGYDVRGLFRASMTFGWRDSTSAAERERLWNASLTRVRALPGVRSASGMTSCANANVVTSDITLETGENAYVTGSCDGVSPDFFRTIGVPIVEGRDFSEGDLALGGAVIVDERAARRLFPFQRAVGHMVKLGNLMSKRPWLRVVGVVRPIQLGLPLFPELGTDTNNTHVYAAVPMSGGGLVIRRDARAQGVEPAVGQVLRQTLPPRVFGSVGPWDSMYQRVMRGEQFISLVFLLLGAASLGLGSAGLFSVVSYVAGQRMREFAVRIALGARREAVLRLVIREGLVMALGGTAVGAGLGMWGGFLLWGVMWGVYPVDPVALVAGEATLLLVTMLACLVPALRATRANPVEILRSA
jgi:predicted permease